MYNTHEQIHGIANHGSVLYKRPEISVTTPRECELQDLRVRGGS